MPIAVRSLPPLDAVVISHDHYDHLDYRTIRTLAERDVPDYYEVDGNKMVAKMTRIPLPSDVPYPVLMEPNLVIEFYSR